MTMNTNDVIKTMNDLIETSRDGEQGFRTCTIASAIFGMPRPDNRARLAVETRNRGPLFGWDRRTGGRPLSRSDVLKFFL